MKTVYIKLTNSCQLKCQHCYNSICNPTDTMSPMVSGFIQNRIENLIKTGNDVMATFHGGEPMLFYNDEEITRVVDFMDYFLNKYPDKISFSTTTNLIYTIQDFHHEIFKRFDKNENGKPIISTSWDYKIRYSSHVQERVWFNNVDKLVKLGYDIRPIITVTKPLINDVAPYLIINLMKDLGVTSLNFERLTCTGRAEENKDSLTPTNKEMQDWLYNAFLVAREEGIKVPLFDILERSVKYGELEGCRARNCVRDVITFNPDGTIATCPNIADEIVGNVAPFTTADIKPEDIKKVTLHMREKEVAEGCYLCEHYDVCNGDCFQLKWDETGCPGLPKVIDYLKELK